MLSRPPAFQLARRAAPRTCRSLPLHSCLLAPGRNGRAGDQPTERRVRQCRWPEKPSYYSPLYAEITSCAKGHVGEVFYAGNLWPASTPFPGQDEVENMTAVKCQTEFHKYTGISHLDSELKGHVWHPNATLWARGDRRVVCLGYHPKQSLNYSIKGLRR
ncbi:septum formation family protein [Actinomadura sp. 9N215]|uniref:septum formation family protein n=1 Tax=Actinomadura sp. 9N215 TaxID=3375150 RepID=UPI00378F9785